MKRQDNAVDIRNLIGGSNNDLKEKRTSAYSTRPWFSFPSNSLPFPFSFSFASLVLGPQLHLLGGRLLKMRPLALRRRLIRHGRSDHGLRCFRSGSRATVIQGHQVRAQPSCVRLDGFQVRLPCLQLLFGVGKDLSGLIDVGKGLAHIARHDGSVVEQVQQASAVFGQDELLFRSFDGGREMHIIGLLDLLTGLASTVRKFFFHTLILSLTMLVSCASATRFCASARTSSCSKVTNLGLEGSLYLSFWISSLILAF